MTIPMYNLTPEQLALEVNESIEYFLTEMVTEGLIEEDKRELMYGYRIAFISKNNIRGKLKKWLFRNADEVSDSRRIVVKLLDEFPIKEERA